MLMRDLGLRWNRQELYITRRHLWVRRQLVAAYLFDDGAGTTLRESTRRGGVGTFVGSPSWTDSFWSSAVNFPGSAARIQLDRSKNPRFPKTWEQFTVMALVRPTSGNLGRILHFGGQNPASASTGGWSFYWDNLTVTNAIVVRLVDTAPTGTDCKVQNVITLNVWQLVGFTVRRRTDAAGWVATAYRDGQVKGSVNSPRTGTHAMTADPTIGAEDTGTVAFIGQIGGLWLWEYGMSPGQVARFARDPFGAWRFDPLTLAKASVAGAPPNEGGGIEAILRRRHGGL